MSRVLSAVELRNNVIATQAKRALRDWRSLRKVDGVCMLHPLRDIWAMRALGMDAAISRPSTRTRHACFSVRQGAFATSVYVDVDACIAWRYPDATEWAWEALSNEALHTILHRERWHDFIPGPVGGWGGVRLEDVGPVPGAAGMMLEVVHLGACFFFQQAHCSLELAVDAPPHHEGAFSRACPVTTTVVMGSTRVPLRLLRSLRLGDVTKITTPTLLLRASHIAFPLSLDQGVLTVADLPFPYQEQVSQTPSVPPVAHSVDDDPAPNESSPIWVGELPVELSFAFEPLALTLAELSALRPGDVVPLESGVRLLIHANGRPVGEAELVEVEGVLAAEVTAIHLKSEA
ncbi:FliM/FliN family flagellar motor switch protein [Xanthomonas albilineans]|uniref:FliM/FliN family flagellar motor switch protein n=1 Tax=Xanthomonas albilineans TaxID=29447 RepID=UPI0009BA7991|nr:FliM/FliN family flagellar motor switch protein [Xanthomonas albilineans]